MKLVEIKNNTKAENIHGDNVELRLNQAIEYLKDNIVTNVVVVMVGGDGSVIDSWANRTNPYVMLGALECIKFDFMNSCIEPRD
jgi:hypothetical protein